ncbi:hypothetical protein BDN70DRAFT_939178 [Pholiota conissans]|uniref:Uncharacterized protein n=1 Tax=Pholiota conissans TaxID=109636 RepID=A0A9P5YM48_9AGAR|nr:hypothetical protein BDN70DRAFT_939178 [Pholiota conissans]
MAVVGVSLLAGLDVRVSIIIRSLAAENYPIAGGYDFEMSAEFIRLLDIGPLDNPPISLVEHYHNDWWNLPSLPDAEDHIPSSIHSLLLSQHTINECLAVDNSQRSQSPAGPPDPHVPVAQYTWSRGALPPAEGIPCRKCLAYRSVACSAFDELLFLKTHVEGLSCVFENRWRNSQNRASALHTIYDAAVKQEATLSTPMEPNADMVASRNVPNQDASASRSNVSVPEVHL